MTPGLPDLVVHAGGRSVYIEMKASSSKRLTSQCLGHKLSPQQILYLKRLHAEQIPAYVLIFSPHGNILIGAELVDQINTMTYNEAINQSAAVFKSSFTGLAELIIRKVEIKNEDTKTIRLAAPDS